MAIVKIYSSTHYIVDIYQIEKETAKSYILQ